MTNILKIAFCALSFKCDYWYFLKSLIFNFVQFDENATKHETIINNNQEKILHTVNCKYKENCGDL